MGFSQELRTPFFAVLFFFICLFLYTKLAGPISFSVNSVTTNKSDAFSVEGTGKVTVVPDTAKVNLGITSTSATVSETQNKVNQVINQITKDLKTLGIDEKKIKTINYSVNPNYDFRAGQRITGYTVSATIEVSSPIDKINDVVDKATADGANTVGNVQFIVDEKKKEELQRQARKEAIEQAKKKANDIASDAGIRLGRVINVYEISSDTPYPLAMEKTIPAPGGGEQPTQIQPGETAISITVNLTYEVL